MNLSDVKPLLMELEKRSTLLTAVALEPGSPVQVYRSKNAPNHASMGLLLKAQKDISHEIHDLEPEELFKNRDLEGQPPPIPEVLDLLTLDELVDGIMDRLHAAVLVFKTPETRLGLTGEKTVWAGDLFKCLAIASYAVHIISEEELQELREDRFTDSPHEGIEEQHVDLNVKDFNSAEVAVVAIRHSEEGFKIGFRGPLGEGAALAQVLQARLLETESPDRGKDSFGQLDED